MKKGIIRVLREEIDMCNKKEGNNCIIKNTREILLREIGGDRDKLLNIKANLLTSGDMNEVAVLISVFALYNSMISGESLRIMLTAFVFTACVIIYNNVQKANEGNKYIKIILEDIENNWFQYFEATQIADSEKAERIYIVKVKQN